MAPPRGRYVNKDREKTKKIVQYAEKRGIKVSLDFSLPLYTQSRL